MFRRAPRAPRVTEQRDRTRRESGGSLIEIVIAIVVISISMTGVLLVVDTTSRQSADPMLARQAISIAEAYLEEILQKSFLDPDTATLCPTREATRALYDNICDYNGLRDTGARTQSGAAVAGLDAYQVAIDVDTNATLGGVTGSANVLRIDAAVTDPRGQTIRFSGYRTQF